MFEYVLLGAGLGMLLLYLGIEGYFTLLYWIDAVVERRREAKRAREEEKAASVA